MKWLLRIIVVLAVGAVPTIAGAACSIALALTVDVSGSINEQEYRLQMDGLGGGVARPRGGGCAGVIRGGVDVGAMVRDESAGGVRFVAPDVVAK